MIKELSLMPNACSLQARYREGQMSPVDAVEACLQRIDELNPRLHAFTSIFHQAALEAAELATAAFSRGEDLGALQGVPVAIKDLATSVEGPSAAGTVFLQQFLGREDAALVSLLRSQGAIIIGKTTMTEGAFSVHHPEIPAPINPWAPEYWTGVSSSGSGVAVAAGMVPMALGSDTGGSIRLPSACNRLVGLKPTFGAVSVQGCFALAPSLDHMGPMARTVDDCESMFRVMARVPEARNAHPLLQRVGVDFQLIEQRCSDEVQRAMNAVIQDYRDMDVDVVPVGLPPGQFRLAAAWIETTAAEAFRAHESYLGRYEANYGPAFIFLLSLARSVSDQQLAIIKAAADSFRAGLDSLLGKIDAIICPVLPGPAMSVAEMAAHQPSAEDIAHSMLYTAPFNYSGHPALTLPAGFIDGVPTGYQLIGRRGDDLSLFELARQHEQLRGWGASAADLSWLTARA